MPKGPTFQLTYLTFTDKQKFLGHACVGITQVNEDGSRELIFRVGLFPTNQVEMEDFITNKPGRNFEERSFDISLDQLINVLHQINHDRNSETPESSKPRQPETKAKIHSGEQSTPMGPAYNMRKYNCKDYALSLVRAAGIDDKPLRNMGISIPRFSGKSETVILTPKENGNGVIILTKPESFIQKLIMAIRKLISNEYKQKIQETKAETPSLTRADEPKKEASLTQSLRN